MKAALFANSSWGIVAHLSQVVLLSAFFVMLTRHYPAEEFGKYAVANALMQMMLAFQLWALGTGSSGKLGRSPDRHRLILKFLSTQMYSGVAFAVVATAFAFVLYDNESIRILSAVLAVNIVFDNIINALKALNVADLQQRKTFLLLTLDGLLKCSVAAALFVVPLSLVTLALVLLLARLITVNLFLIVGTSGDVTAGTLLLGNRVSLREIRRLVVSNWPWVALGGVSMATWRVGSIIISKRLGLAETSIYEVAYRLFSAAQMVPVIVATAVFPMLVRLWNANDIAAFRSFYRSTYLYYLLFGCVAYTFVYSYFLVLRATGVRAAVYRGGGLYVAAVPDDVRFPTAFLQGNVLLAMRLERRDLLLNLVLLAVTVAGALIGLRYRHSLATVNLALFGGFVAFHLLQDALLIRRGISSLGHAVGFHLLLLAVIGAYGLVSARWPSLLVFPVFWGVILIIGLAVLQRRASLRLYVGKAFALARR